MVGGLVQNEQVDGLEQQPYHSQTRPLTAREHLDFLFGCLATEHKGTQQVVYLEPHLARCHTVYGVVYGQILV